MIHKSGIEQVNTLMRSSRGTALITGVMVMMMVSVLGIAYVMLTTTNMLRAGRDERRATAFYLAEAGIEYILSDVTTQAEANGGHITSQTVDSTSVLNGLRSGAAGTITVTPDTGLDTSGTIVSSATYMGITESVRVRIKLNNVGVWNNAIFAGIGQAGRGINGNVDIRGSVHILGDGEPFTDLNGNGVRDGAESYTDSNGNGHYDAGEPFVDADGNGVWSPAEPFQDNNYNGIYDDPLTATELATDMSGNANIGNNYDGIPGTLSTRIPALVTQPYGGEMVQTLNTEVRIKHGKMNISGSATAGQTNITGNNIKETLDAMYVTDGYGGNQGASGVNADNGTANGYDLGNRVKFPSLFDQYTDPGTGINYSTYESYLDANSLLVPVSKIDSTVPSFSYSSGGNSISWNQATSTFTVSGIVRIAGDMDLSSKGNTIYFSGKGTIFSKNDVRVHGSVLPKVMFPSTDCMGCIAKRDIQFATGSGESQLSGAGAWYAQRQIVSAKQNKFAGTYVSDYFNMGTNVPSIYQVPTLSSNLPPGMPGNEPIIVIQVVSWRRI
jgi:Tfp pilus assembly protein PilX